MTTRLLPHAPRPSKRDIRLLAAACPYWAPIGPEYRAGRWKITARYDVQLLDGEYVCCVRLRHTHAFTVIHLTVDRLGAYFRPG